jgi:UDP-4-amino-4,6-dideoxy-N-acetyl-beta-L-altrosamine transaminase
MKIPYGKQWISDEDIFKVLEVLKSEYLTTGPYVKQFEEAFAQYVGSKYAIAVANGTAALHLAAQVLGVRTGTDVITTPMSFAASSNCVLYNSGKPVFADITERGLINPHDIERKITDNSIGIIPVHYMGLPCEMEQISRIAKEKEMFIIEDACHAIGARYRNSSIGDCKYSHLTVFSFHPVKHITTGEGGIITTNDDDLNSLIRTLRTHGITKNSSDFKTNQRDPWFQEMHYLGFNYRLTDIQAALGYSQLKNIDKFVTRRREIANVYSEFFEDQSEHVEVIQENDHEFHSYHLYVIKLKDAKQRRKVFDDLAMQGIYCQVHYIPIYWHPYYREIGYTGEYLSNTEKFYDRILSIPMYPALSDTNLDYVLQSFSKVLKEL